MTEPKIIATKEELSSATYFFQEKGVSVEEWKAWFLKRGERILKDAVQKGLFEVELPFPLAWNSKKKDLMEVKKFVQVCLPDCWAEFVEEEWEGQNVRENVYKLEVSWRDNVQNNSIASE